MAPGEAVPDARTLSAEKGGTPFHRERSTAPANGEDGAPRCSPSVQRDIAERIEVQREPWLLTNVTEHRHKTPRTWSRP